MMSLSDGMVADITDASNTRYFDDILNIYSVLYIFLFN